MAIKVMDCDLVVLGAGGSGLIASVKAAETSGKKVIVLDTKGKVIPGLFASGDCTTIFSTGNSSQAGVASGGPAGGQGGAPSGGGPGSKPGVFGSGIGKSGGGFTGAITSGYTGGITAGKYLAKI